MTLSENMRQKLICPSTKDKLLTQSNYLENVANRMIRYPVVNEIPILIANEKSLFEIENFCNKENTTFDLTQSRLKTILLRLLPSISANIKSEQNYEKICSMLPKNSKILIVGGSIKGEGMDVIYTNPTYEIIGSDVSFGPYTDVICDAHDIPFDDEVFDCVILQAVLEHVVDPIRCVAEAYRILKPSGLVYAETPFIQQVHMKQYDFTRFTHLGHRRLFNHFEEVDSGPCSGPGMALAWSYSHFLKSFASSKTMYLALTYIAHMTSFFLKYFDYFLIDSPGSYDAASGIYFMGTKSNNIIADKDIITQFKGMK